jgi:L-cysteine:1D-myo-inositol 2-amino-2-deoxy-alpha-D-glucopyranoside ligase
LDPLLWRAAREGEPSWDGGELGAGRPGWHIECTTITLDHLGMPFDLSAGGSDLIFPHHEMTAVQALALVDGAVFAHHYAHQAMVAYQGEKMSKSKGNLVFVSRLRKDGVDPRVIRMVLLAQHYRTDWEYSDDLLAAAQERLDTWRTALSGNTAPAGEPLIAELRGRLSDDLDTPGALAAMDDWAARSLAGEGDDPTAAGIVARTLDALLGVRV